MSVLAAMVTLVGVLCALDLVLTLGVIRRLREHSAMLSKRANINDYYKTSIRVGEEVGEFTISTFDGELLSRDLLQDETLVAFFSPTCRPCKEKLPKLVDYARTLDGGPSRVLVAVVGNVEEAAEFVATLGPVARIVVDQDAIMIGKAFQIKAYPTVVKDAPNIAGVPAIIDDDVHFDQPAIAATRGR